MQKLLTILLFVSSVSANLEAQEYAWSEKIGGAKDDQGALVLSTNDGGLLSIGTFQDSVDIDPGPGILRLRSPNPGTDVAFVQKTDAHGHLLWALALSGDVGNNVWSRVHSATLDPSGNLFLAGSFYGPIDFDPGPGVVKASFTNMQGGFVLKLDPNGHFIWFKEFSTQSVGFNALLTDAAGNLYIGGAFNGGLDADPGPNTAYLFADNSIAGGGGDIFLIKWTNDGQYIWGKRVGSSRYDNLSSLALSSDGDILATGVFMWTVDFDPGPGKFELTDPLYDYTNGYLFKWSPDGTFKWAKQIYGYSANPKEIRTDENGNIVVCGYVSGYIDIDPGPDQMLVTLPGVNPNSFVIKLDASGDLLWGRVFGGLGDAGINAMEMDELGNIYATGFFKGTAEMDPGPDELNVTSAPGAYSSFVIKLDFLGQLQWLHTISGQSYGLGINVSKSGVVYATGEFQNSIQTNPPFSAGSYTSSGGYDGYVLKLTQDWHFAGNVFYDENGNNLRDPGEKGLKGFVLKAPGTGHYAISNSQGDFHFYYNLIGDVVQVNSPWPGWTLPQPIAIPDSTQAFMSFPAQHAPGTIDVGVSAVEVTPFKSYHKSEVLLQIENSGTSPVVNVPVKFKILEPANSTQLGFESAVPTPLVQTGDTYEWNINTLYPNQSTSIKVTFSPNLLTIGSPVVLEISAPVSQDINPSNNLRLLQSSVLSSFDPNEKEVLPSKLIPASLDTTALRYVIRFQNTGNTPTDFIVIRDTLPQGLDLSTLKFLASSHPCNWRLYGPDILEFRFDPIHLPDSISNEPESHGFVAFTIHGKHGLALGDSILNRAGIFFDYNDAVVTNNAVMKIVSTLATRQPTDADWMELSLHPNPVAANSPVTISLAGTVDENLQINVFDDAGRSAQRLTVPKGEKQFVLHALSAGSYFVQVRAGARVGGKTQIVR